MVDELARHPHTYGMHPNSSTTDLLVWGWLQCHHRRRGEAFTDTQIYQLWLATKDASLANVGFCFLVLDLPSGCYTPGGAGVVLISCYTLKDAYALADVCSGRHTRSLIKK